MDHVLAVTIALLIDHLIGDPPTWPHPVRWIGTLIGFLDKKWNHGPFRKWKGTLMIIVVLITVFILTWLICLFAYQSSLFNRSRSRESFDIDNDSS